MAGESFGTIRWNAQWSVDPASAAYGELNCLSDARYQYRAPMHAQTLAPNVLTFNPTQANFDAEIAFSHSLGFPHYWAYLVYPQNSDITIALDLHMSSSIASQMKFCLMIQTSSMGTTGNYTTAIDLLVNSYIAKSYYYTLPSGKPLIYIYYQASDIMAYWSNSIANLTTAINYLISRVTAVKGVAPYVVAMVGPNDTTRLALSADATTDYISSFSGQLNGAYAALDSQTQTYWAAMATAVGGSGGHVVPICMMGWDSTPRKRRPIPSQAGRQIPEMGVSFRYVAATNAELITHVTAAKSYVDTNTALCPEKTILCYAWNEYSEGGWISKTLGDPTGARLQAVASVFP